jgi:hypothetical protein
MQIYRQQIKNGVISQAYKGLMNFYASFRTHLINQYPDYHISSIYYGYLDMTYFSFTPTILKQQRLKIAIVFLHEAFRFEVWLAAANKRIQQEYWELINLSSWRKYSLVSSTQGADAILEHILIADPDFADLDQLSHQLETSALKFTQDVVDFLNL